MTSPRWPSLHGQLSLSECLFGQSGPERRREWLSHQVYRISDPAFARSFADHSALRGIAPSDFNHRHLRSCDGEALGGTRFFGGNITRPFVDILGHSFDEDGLGISALADAVRLQWSSFASHRLRLLLTAESQRALQETPLPSSVDTTVHTARSGDMRPLDNSVDLTSFETADTAIQLVNRRYRDIALNDAELSRNISPADAGDIREWHATGHVRAIGVQGRTVGLLAIAQGAIEWIAGDEVNEEVIAAPYTGNRYAAAAQAVWASTLSEPDRLMVGTIDRLNHSSRRTAERAGRPVILSYVFYCLL